MKDKLARQGRLPGEMRVRTLVVEDSSVARQALANLLEMHPIIECVGMAWDANEGFTLTTRLEPDLVLVDMEMPGLGGLTLVEMLRKRFPAMGLVVISTHEGYVWQQLSQTRGADAFITKRCLHKDFADVVERLFPDAAPFAVAATNTEIAHEKAN